MADWLRATCMRAYAFYAIYPQVCLRVCVSVRAILVRRIPHVSAEWRFVWAQLRLCACILLYSFQQNIFILNPLLCGIYGWIPIFSIELCEWIWFQTTFLIRKVSGLLLPPKWMMIFSQSDVCDKINVTLFRVRMKEMRSHSSMISNVYIYTRTHAVRKTFTQTL